MIKESCNVIGREINLVYQLKFHVSCQGKNNFAWYEIISQSFMMNYFLPVHTPQTKRKHPGTPTHIWVWLSTPGRAQPKKHK